MDWDKFAPRIEGTKQEKIGGRPSKYSEWHRTLGAAFSAVDIDYVEYRKDRGIVALIDVTGNMVDEGHIVNSKKFIWRRTDVQRRVLSTISKALNVPAYFVLHTEDLSVFHVHDLGGDLTNFKKMSKQEYETFIKSL